MRRPTFTLFILFVISAYFASLTNAQNAVTPEQQYNEVTSYVANQMRALAANGTKPTRDARDRFESEKVFLAKKYAAETALISAPLPADLLYTALLFEEAKNDEKAYEYFKRSLNLGTARVIIGNGVQIARSRVVVYAGREKQFDEMEKAYADWSASTPTEPTLRASLERSMAAAYFNAKNYEQATKYAKSAFELVRKLEAKTWRERSQKTDIYADLVETMILSYKSTNRKNEAIDVLAEARATAFTIPSASLYTKVMGMVEKYGISEKKLMQKVESYPQADAAPDFAVKQWLGQDPATLEALRGKVVLLDFWATWCGPCISTFPRLRSWHKKYGPQGFTIVGVTQFYGNAKGKKVDQPGEMEFLKSFKDEYKLPYGFAITEGPDTSSKYGISGIPATFLLDRHGVVRYIGVGASTEEAENLEEMIEKVLAEK